MPSYVALNAYPLLQGKQQPTIQAQFMSGTKDRNNMSLDFGRMPGGNSATNNGPYGSNGFQPQTAGAMFGESMNTMPTMGADAGGGGGFSWGGAKDFLFGGEDAEGNKTNGAAGAILGAAQGVTNLYFGMKQNKMAQRSFDENQRQFNLNFDSQKKTTNSRLSDRQDTRNRSSRFAQDKESYMAENGVTG
jgi:hypothetical protein